MYELIITEKPAAAKKIADALADGKAIKENLQGVPYYKVTRGKKDIAVACAVGHLYGLSEREKKGWMNYPVFEIEWRPVSESSKNSLFTRKYLNVIKKLAKDANEFTVACDYDQEGEVIGLNVIRYACKKKDAYRMKFSTLTKDDLIKAYENKSKHIDWGQANAGEARHFLDWYNGINYSRALTSAIKSTGAFKLMSTGRVQGPALKIIVDREREIKSFVSKPFWQILLSGTHKNTDLEALHKDEKFWEKEKADAIMSKVMGQKKASIREIERKQFNQVPPFPFDLTSLQVEAYRCFGISPKETLEKAQELYISGLISYPRTSSQQLPDAIGFSKIISDLGKQSQYTSIAKTLLLKKSLAPNNGKKTDPAHPAIYPTGVAPGDLSEKEAKVYDLIVKRFFAVFGENAVRETLAIIIDCNSETFIARGTRTIKKGWHELYQPYVNLQEVEFPNLQKNDAISVKKIELLSKETLPPKRYTPASIIKELEKRNLGTKATRSEIIDTLFSRGYIDGKAIGATNLGISTIETLEKYSPKIIDEELTKYFELEMEKIRDKNEDKKDILERAKDSITKILEDFKKNQKEIGIELAKANRQTQDEMSQLGQCPSCKQGSIMLRRGKFGMFAACNKYPDCKTIFSIPKNALIKPAKKSCETCTYPKVLAIKKGKQPLEFCLNPKCPDKNVEGAAGKAAKAIAKGTVKKKCPTCNEGEVVLRSSIYGKFYGCSRYPKCNYTHKIDSNFSQAK